MTEQRSRGYYSSRREDDGYSDRGQSQRPSRDVSRDSPRYSSRSYQRDEYYDPRYDQQRAAQGQQRAARGQQQQASGQQRAARSQQRTVRDSSREAQYGSRRYTEGSSRNARYSTQRGSSARDYARSGETGASRYRRQSNAPSRAGMPRRPQQSNSVGGARTLLQEWFGNGINVRFIIAAVAAIALIVLVGFGVSRCVGQAGNQAQTAQTAQTGTAQSASAASTSAASASSAAGVSSQAASAASSTAQDAAAAASQGAASGSATSAAAAPTPVERIPSQQGDVTYPVTQAAKLAYRDVDLALDPNRTTWNMDKTNGHKTVYLTFDDGPSKNTERVLDILDRYGAKATFFVTGQEPEYFPWMKEAYRRGHTIGLHSMTHDYEAIYSSTEAFWADIDTIGKAVKEQIGYVPFLLRFPGGSSNTVSAEYSQGIMTQLVGEAIQRGYQYYDWTLSCGDGADLSTEETIAAGTEPTDEENPTYLLHDAASKDSTVEALPTIIEYFQSQGYTFEALDRNSLVCHHGVSN